MDFGMKQKEDIKRGKRKVVKGGEEICEEEARETM